MTKPSIFITGAGSGIGKATAELFAAQGWRIALCDIDCSRIESLAAELGDAVTAYQANVCDPDSLASALEAFAGADGFDVLFNCAGILEMREFAECSLAAMHKLIDVNVNGVINGMHLALPYLRQRPRSRIITMSSVAAVHGIPEEAAYSASKFAVRALTEALNIELEAAGIWVCDVMVAYVATPMVLSPQIKARSVDILGVNVMPQQVAETVWQALKERKVHWFVTPEDEAIAQQIDSTLWEERRGLMKQITGFA
ncbi:SDR family oxidoreductase [Blastomonas sp. SL216]|uniref:SDR family oxidoreductase n=1 Tax=Blastomonas sp. SL216 TaxID=2995169 RepID=UPI002377214D|nr:SDR family oxidoreductase [Blastomonas sp. SL216]